MFLYHYYEKQFGPFLNLSELTMEEANLKIQEMKEKNPKTQCAQRDENYMFRRHMYEDIMRQEFIKKGGRIEKNIPHYMVLEASQWLTTWYQDPAYIRIDVKEFDLDTISFTYGDSHPTFSPYPREDDWKEYRRKIYTYNEILDLIQKYDFPQKWNNDGKFGPERYIEAQIWSDETIRRYHLVNMK